MIPGRAVFAKLERRGLCFETEEEPMDDGFEFTSTLELTGLGIAEARQVLNMAPCAPRKPSRR